MLSQLEKRSIHILVGGVFEKTICERASYQVRRSAKTFLYPTTYNDRRATSVKKRASFAFFVC